MSTHPTHTQRARELAEEHRQREEDRAAIKRAAELMFGTEPTLDTRKERINQQGYLAQDLGILAAYTVGMGGRDATPDDVHAAHAACYGAGFPELKGFEVETVQEMMGRAIITIDGVEHTV